jgi:hypothetical protein
MAGIEERLTRLEKILNKVLCCETNEFTGPQGPVGAPGRDGAPGSQGPQGVPGPVGPAGLNWMGTFVPCVVYSQNDAVSFEGASYFVTCEDTSGGECESPYDNTTCWALLASQGATGPMGPQGPAGTSATIPPLTQASLVADTTSPPTITEDINFVTCNASTDSITLPSPSFLGQEILVLAQNNLYNFFVKSASFIIEDHGTQFPVNSLTVQPNNTYRFTWNGKAWTAEAINGRAYKFNNYDLVRTLFNIKETEVNSVTSGAGITLAYLNSTYTSAQYPIGFKVYFTIPKTVAIKISNTDWVSISFGTIT